MAGKFFDMPKSTKAAPPQQANLQEMWGKKKEPILSKLEPHAPKAEADAMVVDTPKEEKAESSKRKESGTPIASSPKIKKRRIIDSDDEDPNDIPPRSSPEPTLNGSTKSSSPIPDLSLPSSKVRDKEQALTLSGTTTNGVSPPDDAESSSSEEDQGEEEAEDLEEEEDEEGLATEKAVNTKSAQVALQKRDDVDIEGGWPVGKPVPYAALSKAFSLIEATTKRLEKNAILTSFLLLVIQRSAKSDHASLLQAVYLCINRLCPDYVGIELGIGESLLIKAIAESTGRSLSVIKADLKKEGDLGLVAMNSKNSQKTLFKPKPLTIPFVFSHLKEIALSSGHSSQAKKVSIITKLLAACQGVEAKYIVRSLEGKLRIGNAERSVLVALSQAAVLAERERSNKKWSQDQLAARLEESANIMKSVYSELPTYDLVIPALLEVGIDGLRQKCKLTPGVPLKPMLAKPTKAIGEVLDRFENKRFTCEYKYDGERAQVHLLEDGSVKVFSRNSEDMSKKYPDLVDQLPKCIKETTKSFVFDAEAVAIDRTTGKLMPFQELSRRKRKDVKVEDITVQVSLFAFDLLYLNGEPLLQLPLYRRRELLREHFVVVPGEFGFAKSSDSETTEEIQSFLEESVKDGCEGLMVKMLDTDASFYEPSRRSVNWLKLKKDYLAGVGDSLDLVVVGGYYGKGKRTNVYGAFLLACYDSDSEEYQTICKIGTGFSEEVLQTHYNTLKPLETTKPRGDIKVGGAKPDIWFEPKIVWEVLTADLSLSPIYTAAQGLVEDRGISLRFPRYLRIRDDKSADDATGPEQAKMYERQALAQPKGKKKKGGDADDEFW
ncbi:DNA ligase 1 [Psilocybe cubensis]|uniref:DNA ligase n=2 Tax=Psilocybe cubensis TaxID=181762 RepID=A0A8H7Y8I0_PSICU|nr:DNA ligase 1 [Psilocybe cubensis]KAH9486949.1 DNA ligase 1 [Psilocybe cubensis]